MEKNAKIMGMDNVERLIEEGRLRKRRRGEPMERYLERRKIP